MKRGATKRKMSDRSGSKLTRFNWKWLLVFVLIAAIIYFVFNYQRIMFSPNLLSSCGDLSIPGVYTLNSDLNEADLTFNPDLGCFRITSSDITFDCQNHKISGYSNNSIPIIKANSVKNITLQNCFFDGFGMVEFQSVSDSVIKNNYFTNKSKLFFFGVSLYNSKNISIIDNNFDHLVNGITLEGGDNYFISRNNFSSILGGSLNLRGQYENLTVTDNSFSNNRYAIFYLNSNISRDSFSSNIFLNNSYNFYYQGVLTSCQNLTIPGGYVVAMPINAEGYGNCFNINTSDVNVYCAGNSISNFSNSGFFAENVSNVSINRCYLSTSYNSTTSIIFNNVTYSQISNSTIISPGNGIKLYDSKYNTISFNNITNKSLSRMNRGIELSSSHFNKVFSNDIANIQDIGIWIYMSYTNNVSMNKISKVYNINFYSQFSDNNLFSFNNISSGTFGFALYFSSNITLDSNIINGSYSGVFMSIVNNSLIKNNFIFSTHDFPGYGSLGAFSVGNSLFVSNNISGGINALLLSNSENNTFTSNNIFGSVNGIVITHPQSVFKFSKAPDSFSNCTLYNLNNSFVLSNANIIIKDSNIVDANFLASNTTLSNSKIYFTNHDINKNYNLSLINSSIIYSNISVINSTFNASNLTFANSTLSSAYSTLVLNKIRILFSDYAAYFSYPQLFALNSQPKDIINVTDEFVQGFFFTNYSFYSPFGSLTVFNLNNFSYLSKDDLRIENGSIKLNRDNPSLRRHLEFNLNLNDLNPGRLELDLRAWYVRNVTLLKNGVVCNASLNSSCPGVYVNRGFYSASSASWDNYSLFGVLDSSCGNGIVDLGSYEICDGNIANLSCADYGSNSGFLTCNNCLSIDSSRCFNQSIGSPNVNSSVNSGSNGGSSGGSSGGNPRGGGGGGNGPSMDNSNSGANTGSSNAPSNANDHVNYSQDEIANYSNNNSFSASNNSNGKINQFVLIALIALFVIVIVLVSFKIKNRLHQSSL